MTGPLLMALALAGLNPSMLSASVPLLSYVFELVLRLSHGHSVQQPLRRACFASSRSLVRGLLEDGCCHGRGSTGD